MEKAKTKKYKLVKFDDNWADEMDISGYIIMESDKWEKIENNLKNYKDRIYVGFGTNEDNDYRNGKEFLNTIDVKNITEEEIKTLKKLLGSEYGNTSFSYAFENVDEGDEIGEDND